MNRRLQQAIGPWLHTCPHFAAALAGLVLVIESSGCASGRPAPLRIDHPIAAAPANDSDYGVSLKLVTYNVWGLPSWMTGARSGRYPRIARELERLDTDVILLQEAWTPNARKSAPAGTRWAIARAAGQHTFFQQSGLVTLSRFPIIGGRFYPFSRAAFPDRLVNKGVLKVTLQLANGQVLNVWNVHLQDAGSSAVRFTQVRELIMRVRAAEDGQIADLVAGDFNCTPGSSLYQELSHALGPSVQELSGSTPFVTWDGLSAKPGAGETLDHIFVRRRTPFETVQASPHVAFSAARREDRLSDHFGIEAELNLSSGTTFARAVEPGLNGPSASSLVSDGGTYAAGD
jgi:endonuclease/exonuclease/phosphatase family metal-dependent hydrolase